MRTFCGTKSQRFDDLSKLTKIETLREKIQESFDVAPELQKLFYRGKLLVDNHTLFDYNVGINDTIQLMISKPVVESEEKEEEKESEVARSEEECTGLYKVGEEVDVYEQSSGAWFEGNVNRVFREVVGEESTVIYVATLDGYDESDKVQCKHDQIRPRAHHMYTKVELVVGLKCMVNHNFDTEGERGFWYNAEITEREEKNKKLCIKAKIELGETVSEVTLAFTEDIFRIESRSESDEMVEPLEGDKIAKRTSAPDCIHCKDEKKNCKFCACSVCGSKNDPNMILLCDECDYAFHLYCLKPKLTAVPEEDDWYCPTCKHDDSTIVRAGEGVKASKKKASSASAKQTSNRDWGKGMACQGRTKICSIVPSNHIGAVPGVPVGSMWKFRLQVSEAGIHRPHVAGIHGRESDGAYSIVLSGGYEDDKDYGDEFYYTGSGGRDLSGNKRTAVQSCDQILKKMNLALAKCCAAPVNAKDGGEADDWKKGRQIRVVRNCKLRKHSKYAPDEGNRYDGIYKVAKYWAEKGQSGFLVWRYLLKRDDELPAPWTKEGKKNSEKLGLELVYPAGYLEAQSNKENSGQKNGKRKNENSDEPASKKKNLVIDDDVRALIAKDVHNEKGWAELLDDISDWHNKVTDTFTCICCTDVVYEPVTTECKHNICLKCLKRSFKAEVYTCPFCRFDLGKGYGMKVNKELQAVLMDIFPGYNAGR